MAPQEKEPNRHQLSSRLSYQQTTPSFLLKLQNRVKGLGPIDEDVPQYSYEDDRGEYYNDGAGDEYYDDGSGRPPIPQRPRDDRPPIPERPDDDPGSADEDEGDEKPQVVVLKQGRHLTALEAENIKRKKRGFPPLTDPGDVISVEDTGSKVSGTGNVPKRTKEANTGLSFSSGASVISKSKKRKVTDSDLDFEKLKDSVSGKKDKEKSGKASKKPKKEKKTLLSFGDDA